MTIGKNFTDGKIATLPLPKVVREKRIALGSGLVLGVRKTGQRVFYYQWTELRDKAGNPVKQVSQGRTKTLTIGDWGLEAPGITIRDAKARTEELRQIVESGANPAEVKKITQRTNIEKGGFTFDDAHKIYMDSKIKKKNAEKTIIQANSVYTNYLKDKLGPVPFKFITSTLINECFDACPFPRVKEQMLGIVRALYRIARARSIILHDLSDTIMLDSLPKIPLAAVTDHQTQLILFKSFSEIPFPEMQIYFRLLAYTFVRPTTLTHATWDQFDLNNLIWFVPAGQMKKRRDFWTPITPAIHEQLTKLYAITGKSKYLFPLTSGPDKFKAPMNRTRPIDWLVKLGWKEKQTAHGFRALATTVLTERRVNLDLIRLAMAHKDRSSLSPYDRASMFGPRFEMHCQWCDYIDALYRGDPWGIAARKINPAEPLAELQPGEIFRSMFEEAKARREGDRGLTFESVAIGGGK